MFLCIFKSFAYTNSPLSVSLGNFSGIFSNPREEFYNLFSLGRRRWRKEGAKATRLVPSVPAAEHGVGDGFHCLFSFSFSLVPVPGLLLGWCPWVWRCTPCAVASVVSDSLQSHGLYIACQAPLSTWFPRLEYWSGLPSSPPRDLPYPAIKHVCVSCIAGRFFTFEPLGSRLSEKQFTWPFWMGCGFEGFSLLLRETFNQLFLFSPSLTLTFCDIKCLKNPISNQLPRLCPLCCNF